MSSPLHFRLDAPVRLAVPTLLVRGTARVREAVRIRLRDAEGRVGLGEAVPLPGYSPDDAVTVELAVAALAACLADRGLAVPDGANSGRGAAARLAVALEPHAALLAGVPSARFALECALVDLLAQREGVSAAQWLADGRALHRVPVSILLPDDESRAPIAAAEASARGHRVLKLKIARSDRTAKEEDELLAAVRAAADAAGAGVVRLRLDANGALDSAGVARRLAALARHGVELVEEPVAGEALLALPPLSLPWAADESLADAVLAEALLALPTGRRPAAFVLKPALLGLARCLILADAAVARGIGLIVTHSFDGDPGYAAACALAAALPAPPWPCGLAPHAGLLHPPPVLPWLLAPSRPGLGVIEAAGAPR